MLSLTLRFLGDFNFAFLPATLKGGPPAEAYAILAGRHRRMLSATSKGTILQEERHDGRGCAFG
jgi:hypothetical protein